MKSYKLVLLFDNLDNFMGTDHQAIVSFDAQADDYRHATLLAERFAKVFEADRYELNEMV